MVIEMTSNVGVIEPTTQQKKEVINTFDITPTNGLQVLRDKADSIQALCSDAFINSVSLENLAVYYSDLNNVFTAKFLDEDRNLFSKEFSDFSFGQLCCKLGIPTRYIISCAKNNYSDLAVKNINTWIDDYGKSLLFRMYNDKVRAVLSDRYSVFDTPDILDVLNDSTRGLGLKVKSYFLNEERFHARLIQREQMKVNGEDLFAGIQIDSSDVGRSTLNVRFFIFKQICTNGLCISKGKANLFEQKHISICADDFREGLTESLKVLPELIDEYAYIIQRTALSHSILGEDKSFVRDETDKLLEELVAKVKLKTKLSDDGAKKVATIANTKYGLSDWGIINAITEVAQDYTLERRIELETIAGTMLRAV